MTAQHSTPLLDRMTKVATIVIAFCTLGVTGMIAAKTFGEPERSAGSGRESRTAPTLDSVAVPQWEKYLALGHARGPSNAPITIVEFGDYQCPYCGRYAKVLDSIVSAFPGKVRVVYRHRPLSIHKLAYPAARAAECAADQGKFWEMHDLIYAEQKSLGSIPFDDQARRAGVPDLVRFRNCTASIEPIAAIEQGSRDARAAGGRGTPTLVVNGVFKRRVDSAYIARVLQALDEHAARK